MFGVSFSEVGWFVHFAGSTSSMHVAFALVIHFSEDEKCSARHDLAIGRNLF